MVVKVAVVVDCVLSNKQDGLWNSELHRAGSTTKARPHVYRWYLGCRLHHVSRHIFLLYFIFTSFNVDTIRYIYVRSKAEYMDSLI